MFIFGFEVIRTKEWSEEDLAYFARKSEGCKGQFSAAYLREVGSENAARDFVTRVWNDVEAALDRLNDQERDYTLQEVVSEMTYIASLSGDAIVVGGNPDYPYRVTIPMEGGRWLECGHQHSNFKQWAVNTLPD